MNVPLIVLGVEVRQPSHLNGMLSTPWPWPFTGGLKAFFLFFPFHFPSGLHFENSPAWFCKLGFRHDNALSLYYETIISQEASCSSSKGDFMEENWPQQRRIEASRGRPKREGT